VGPAGPARAVCAAASGGYHGRARR
jgi:hypothetical protein